jgi:hypothetical protein
MNKGKGVTVLSTKAACLFAYILNSSAMVY